MEQFNDRLDNSSGNAPAEPQRRSLLRRLVWLVLTACGLLAAALIAFSAARPSEAAVAVQYFEASANAYGVLLSWGTSSEQNVQSFDIFCKKAGEPDDAFHFIHSVQPKGSLSESADYSWLVEASALTPGQAYCFRVKEISTEPGIPGWSRDACGFGVNITPTPTPTQTAIIVEVTATPAFVTNTAALAPTPTQVGFSAPPTADLFLTATAVAAQTASADAVATQNAAAAAAFGAPTPTPTLDPAALTATMDAFNSVQPTPEPTFSPTITATLPTTTAMGAGDPGVGVNTALLQPTPSPTSLYIVATAEPTPAPVALAPVLTPWPTATPAPALAMSSLLSPTAQNLTVMLLCFIFVSASGLGALGLITSVIYIRSQSRRRELEDLRRRSRTRY